MLTAASGRADPEAIRLLGNDDEMAWRQAHLPFTRTLSAQGFVSGSLVQSTVDAGVPATAMLEALRAFSTAIDLESDLRDGDRFYVRYEQSFTIEDRAFGVGRVVWAELRTATRGTIAIHRFRAPRATSDSFWLATGQATTAPVLAPPLKTISVSSGFGMRADPLDQPWARSVPMGPLGKPQGRLPPGLQSGTMVDAAAFGQWPSTARVTPSQPSPSSSSGMVMHEGVDLVAAPGTAILAAGDGVVKGAAVKGRYGNWVEIDHDGGYGGLRLATVYGHLSAFAPGIAAGVRVSQGEVIGFVGTTGRTTGPHLHFEVLAGGRPGNPIGHPATRRAQLRGADLDGFRRVVARNLAERERETGPL